MSTHSARLWVFTRRSRDKHVELVLDLHCTTAREGLQVISADDVRLRRIIGFDAQILHAPESTHPDVLLKVFFNDNRLISVKKCRHSTGPGGLEIGIEP